MSNNKEPIARAFNKIVYAIITRVENKSRCEDDIANLDRLRRLIAQYKQFNGEESLISTAAPIFMDYAEPILSCNDSFFTTMDVRKEFLDAGGEISSNYECVFSLIESVKSHYAKIGVDEKKQIFSEVNMLLSYSSRYLM